MKTQRIILAGGTGFLGRLLSETFAAQHWDVIVLTRSPRAASGLVRHLHWDGRTSGPWTRELEAADVVINLSGRSVNCRYTPENRREILESRVAPTIVLGQAISRCAAPPPVWLNASTATIYKHSLMRAMDESGEIGGTAEAKDEFSVEVAQAWEKAFAEAPTPATRKVPLRMAMVFGVEPGTVFRVLRQLVRLGLGGSMGGGHQFVSWIHEADFCRAIAWIIANNNLRGPVNLVSPNPLTNREMMRTLRQVCGAPLGLPATRWMLEIGAFLMRTETELMIKSRRVVPGRLVESGFEFQFPQFKDALRDVECRVAQPRKM